MSLMAKGFRMGGSSPIITPAEIVLFQNGAYNEDTKYEMVTSTSGTGSVSITGSVLRMYASSAAVDTGGHAIKTTKHKIDLTKYNSIIVSSSFVAGAQETYYGHYANDNPIVAVSATQPSGSFPTNVAALSIRSNGTATLDISSLIGEYYVYVGSNCIGNSGTYTPINKPYSYLDVSSLVLSK